LEGKEQPCPEGDGTASREDGSKQTDHQAGREDVEEDVGLMIEEGIGQMPGAIVGILVLQVEGDGDERPKVVLKKRGGEAVQQGIAAEGFAGDKLVVVPVVPKELAFEGGQIDQSREQQHAQTGQTPGREKGITPGGCSLGER
jgi:hypothetical protein